MLTMESSQLDAALERLLDDLPQFAPGPVWIGARQSTDPAWRYINGSVFNTQGKHRECLWYGISDCQCVYLPVCLSVCLCTCPSLCLSTHMFDSANLSIPLSICLAIYVSIYLYVYLSIRPSDNLLTSSLV